MYSVRVATVSAFGHHQAYLLTHRQPREHCIKVPHHFLHVPFDMALTVLTSNAVFITVSFGCVLKQRKYSHVEDSYMPRLGVLKQKGSISN